MGNSSSKHKKDLPKFSRTDTSTSQRSSRSRRSIRSNNDDAASFRTATSEISKKFPSTPLMSRRNSSVNNFSGGNNNTSNTGNNNNLTLNVNNNDDDEDFLLPPSMVQMEPKTPILIRRDSSNVNSSTIALDSSVNASSMTGYSSDNNLSNHRLSQVSSRHNSFTNSPNTSTDRPSFSRRNSDALSIASGLSNNNNSSMLRLTSDHSVKANGSSSTPGTPRVISPVLSKVNSRNSEDINNNAVTLEKSLDNLNIENNGEYQQHQLQYQNMSDGNIEGSLTDQNVNGNEHDLSNGHGYHHHHNAIPNDNNNEGSEEEDENVVQIEDLIQKLLDAGYSGKRTKSVCLKNSEIQLICNAAREIFLAQPTLLELSPPVKIVGDVHGQYMDLIRMFSKCGFPPTSNYLFLGDYVDRGKQSLETILLLLCYKIKYPENFFLLRGNHECANVTRVYGFYDECKRRTNIKTWKLFIDTFNTLPIASIVANKIFCVHGGLSPTLQSMDDIRNIQRPTDVPDFGLLNDLLWSDPADTPNEWEDNERGVSYCFSKTAINKFLAKFNFDLICRAHMVVEDGYEFFNDKSLVTVFSAPNYCGEFDNWGAVMAINEELLCSFELLDPLDPVALKQFMKKGKHERKNAHQNLINQS